jgi:hypothetical protein
MQLDGLAVWCNHTAATFVGTPAYIYTFRIKATDNVNNTPPILDFGLPILDWAFTISP